MVAAFASGTLVARRRPVRTEAFKITPQTAARRRHHLEKQAAALGLRIEPAA
jgi:hypothetical protein